METSSVQTIVSHDSCPDGLASSMIVREVLPNAEYKFVQHNTPDHKALQPQPGILFVDFSPFVGVGKDLDQGLLKAWGESGSLILDHHKTARHVVEAFGENGRFGDEATEPGVCGATLAFRHIWKARSPDQDLTVTVGEFARLAGIRDTWVRNSPDWEEACKQASVLMFMPRDLWFKDSLANHLHGWNTKYNWVGNVLDERYKKSVEKAVRGGFRFASDLGTRVIIFDSLSLTSDACELLGDQVDLVMGYSTFVEAGEIKTIYSNRAHGPFNCSEFAKRNGGGGHTKAAGFSVSGICDHPITRAIKLLNLHEFDHQKP